MNMIKVIEHILNYNQSTSEDIWKKTIKEHDTILLEWLLVYKEPYGYIYYDAILSGNLQILQMIYKHVEWNAYDMTNYADLAASIGALDILKWIIEETNFPQLSQKGIDKAAGNGFIHILEWLYPKYRCSTRAMDLAAINGFLDVVEWLYNNEPSSEPEFSILLAIQKSQYHIVQFLSKMLYPENPNVDQNADTEEEPDEEEYDDEDEYEDME